MRSPYRNEALSAISGYSAPSSDDNSFIALATLFLRICDNKNNRECNILLETFHHHVGGLETFVGDFRTVSSIRKKAPKPNAKTVAHSGFEKRTLRSSNEVEYTVYLRNAVAVIEDQVNVCDDDNIFTTSE